MQSQKQHNAQNCFNFNHPPLTPTLMNSNFAKSPMMTAKSVTSFFAEPLTPSYRMQANNCEPASPRLPSRADDRDDRRLQQQQLRHQQLQQQQEDNYHLYHEPEDPDEHKVSTDKSPILRSSPLSAQSKTCSGAVKLASKFARCPPLPPQSLRHANVSNSNTRHSNWPIQLPNALHGNKSNSSDFGNVSEPVATPVEQDDVSAEIYHCYVTSKTGSRADSRSRSYHGPKNTSHTLNPKLVADQAPYARDAAKNLSSNSVAELCMSPSAFMSCMMPVNFRDHCVRELIETESNYVHALDMILKSFAKPLECLLKRDENQLIFGHIKQFHHIHSSLQSELVKAALRTCSPITTHQTTQHRSIPNSQQPNSNPSTPTAINGGASNAANGSQQHPNVSPLASPLADLVPPSPSFAINSSTSGRQHSSQRYKISTCFLNVKDKLLKYGEYCASLCKAQALLDELSNRNEAIAATLDRCQQEANDGKFKLRDLLSLPMQRILKYHLLLAQLIKNTSNSHSDYQGLKRAHEAMVDLGQYINEVKRDTEAMQIIDNIERSITGLNMPANTKLIDYGRLVNDGFLRIKNSDTRTKVPNDSLLKLPHDLKQNKQKRYIFVFDKVMLICKPSGLRSYQYKEALVLSEFDIDQNPSTVLGDANQKHAAKDKWSFSFNLIRKTDKTFYTFFAKTQDLKLKWVESILKAMDNIHPEPCRNNETNHEFIMHTFDKALSCDHCGKLLLGLYYQGYRCRTCFTSAHKKCLGSIRQCGSKTVFFSDSKVTNRHSMSCKVLNEPQSPSIRSNCSDDSHNMFAQPCSASNSSSTQCIDKVMRNEYSNLKNDTNGAFLTGTNGCAARPVASMFNVSQQSHTLHSRSNLKSSKSTPAISLKMGTKARATTDYEGDEENGCLSIRAGDVILLLNRPAPLTFREDDFERSMSHMQLNEDGSKSDQLGSPNGMSILYGRNMRTGKDGRFPATVVQLMTNANDADDNNNNDDVSQSKTFFILDDYPWFCGKMERDHAEQLLKVRPNGAFLVRVSPKFKGSYVISLNYHGQVKHMRIFSDQDNRLYLSGNRFFNSVVQLVEFYEKNSLVENFHMLDAYLTLPYKSI